MNRVIPKNTAAQSLLAGKLCSYETTNTEKQPIALIHQDARFFLITAGSGEMSVQNRQYPLTANTIVSIMPWQICDIFQINSPLEYQMITYNYDALTRAVKIFSNEEGQTESFLTAMECHSAVTLMPENRTICRLMDMIAKELSISDPNELPSQRAFQNISITSLLVQLLIRFLRLSSELKAEEPHVQTDYTEILRYIYLHCNEKLSLDNLSCRFNCPASDISSYLTDTIGISFSELLNEIRIGKSLNFIMYTDFTLKEMSEFLGYVDESHISKVFAARIGTKISEYRKIYQKVQNICRIDETRTAYTVINYIYRNYADDLNPQGISHQFGLSVPQLNTLLLYQVEQSFSEFLNQVRVNRASELLLIPSKTVLEVAFEVGYRNSKTFTRNFVKLKGMTPTTFKQKYMGKASSV